MNNLNLAVIIPVYNIVGDEDKKMFGESVGSVFNQKNDVYPSELVIITDSKTKSDVVDNIILDSKEFKKIKSHKDVQIKIIINDENPDNYQAQINKAVKETTTDYFVILDSDDEFTNIYMSNLDLHMKNITKDAYLTLVIDTNLNKEPIRYINEICWAKDVTGENHGELTQGLLKDYNLVSLNGAAISKEKFLEIGGLKESFKLSFMYELLLRFSHNDGSSYCVPKIGYIRKNGRPNSLMANLMNELSEEEVKFWWNLAKTEFLWPFDRNKTFKPTKEALL
jgi:glycosyltransferase involved in cell wall biosynthesis